MDNDKDILRFSDDDDDEDVVHQEQSNESKTESDNHSKSKIKPTSSANRPGAKSSGRRKTLISTNELADTASQPKQQTKPVQSETPTNGEDILEFGDDAHKVEPDNNSEVNTKPSGVPKARGFIKPTIVAPDEPDNDEADTGYEVYNDVLVEDSYIKELREKEEKKLKKIKTPAQKKRRKIILASAAVVFVGVLLLLNVRQSNLKNKDVNYEVVDLNEYVNAAKYVNEAGEIDKALLAGQDKQTGQPSKTPVTEITTTENGEVIPVETTTTIVERKDLKVVRNVDTLNVGEYACISKTEQVKVSSESGYEKFDTEYYFGVSNITSGYDKVKASIDAYNNDPSTKKAIKVNDKSAYENEGLTLVEFDIDVAFPEDYPTNLSAGEIGKVEEPILTIVGVEREIAKTTEAETTTNSEDDETGENEEVNTVEDLDFTKYIVVNGEAYSLEDPLQLYVKPSRIKVAEGFTYKYVAQLPIGAKPEDYEVYVELDGKKIQVKTVEIKG